MSYKSGFITIIGRPNVGKSTLMNALIGEKISIISDKPQTTRNNIKTVITTQEHQMIFIDTPGIHKPKNKLGDFMVDIAESTLKEVDVILFIVEATESDIGKGDRFILEQLKNSNTPVILLINKIDLIKKEQVLSVISKYGNLMDYKAVIPISAIHKDGMQEILKEISTLLPEGPQYFPEDMLTDQPERVLVAELVRERVLQLLNDEVPHGVGVEVISFKKREGKEMVDIEATIYCEKDTHKGIIIGKSGVMLKKIGSLSRGEIENLLGSKVFLQLWVKVKPDWRNHDSVLKTLGYKKS